MLEFSHKPVMLDECMDALKLYDGGIWFDGTVGGGGHSYEILKRTKNNGKLIATDLDPHLPTTTSMLRSAVSTKSRVRIPKRRL